MKKNILAFVIAVIVIGGVSFYGGMLYAQTMGPKPAQAGLGNLRNLSPEERQARLQQFGGTAGAFGGRGGNANGGFTGGQIIAQDDKSITVKLMGGGSKIIFFDSNTQIMHTVTATTKDLKVGDQVSVNGTANQDGSLTAQMIQIRPVVTPRNSNTNANTNTATN